jgi:phage baseplate assembly protein W
MSIANRTYRDIALSFFANPMSGDVGKKTGADAVKQALIAILKTNYNERLFDPEFGTDIRGSLFEQMNPITEQRMRKKIEAAIARHEPRAEVLGVSVKAQEEQNRYEISILFNVASVAEIQKITTYFDALG